MTTTNDSEPQATRRIRPWLAGLLTFLGWGVGLYYARRARAAIYVVIAQIASITLIAIGLITYLAFNGPLSADLTVFNPLPIQDGVSLLLTFPVVFGVWVFVAKNNTLVERASPARLWGYLGIWLLPIVGAALVALPIRVFLIQPFHIPAGSMKPTLQVGEFFAVDKKSFGYSRASLVYPFTRIPVKGRIFDTPPVRGDVVVFKNVKDGNKDYVNRLIGLPGDTIQFKNGVLHINGKPVEKEFVEIGIGVCNGANAPIYQETLGNSVSYLVQECSGNEGGLDNIGPYIVPEGHYFMLGDNRDQSQDSRIVTAVGYIPHDSLVGKALIKNH